MGPATIIAGLNAGAKILGAIGARKSKTTTSRTNFKQMRDDALAAGFNPVTALKATGGAGNVNQTMPGLSSLEMLSEITGAGADYFAATDPMVAETRQLEMDILRRQKELMDRELGLYGTGFGNPATERYSDPKGMDKVRPVGRPMDDFTFPVRTVTQELIKIPKSWARRNDLRAYETIEAGTLQELIGDLVAEAANASSAAIVLGQMGLNPLEYVPLINRVFGEDARQIPGFGTDQSTTGAGSSGGSIRW